MKGSGYRCLSGNIAKGIDSKATRLLGLVAAAVCQHCATGIHEAPVPVAAPEEGGGKANPVAQIDIEPWTLVLLGSRIMLHDRFRYSGLLIVRSRPHPLARLAFADRLPPEDRWAVVAYVRQLQRARPALAPAPAASRGSAG